MKYIKYITFLLLLILVACTKDDFEQATINGVKGNIIQIIGRDLPFDKYDVKTRATAEDDITMVDFVIFGKNSAGTYDCIYYKHSENQIVNIDRTVDFLGIDESKLKDCNIYVVGNYPEINEKISADAQSAGYTDVNKYINEHIVGKGEGSTAVGTSYFLEILSDVEQTVSVPTYGLPRFGSYVEPIDLTGDISSGKTYEVQMKSLYAKMVFNINVVPTEEISGIDGNKFKLDGYTVHNRATQLDMKGFAKMESPEGTNTGWNDNRDVYTNPIEGSLDGVDLTADRNVSFTLYLPERYLPAATAADKYSYPFAVDGSIREEDMKLRQRYKPLIADEKATFVRFTGVFTNHQGHTYDVSYDIYVGSDNYSNFDVVRNRQYNNNITIKGILNSNESTDENSISIDHRVNISRTSPIISNLRRETLLDAHFEIRPLRIRANMDDEQNKPEIKSNSAVKVIVEYADKNDTGWVGLESSFALGEATGLYCTNEGSSKGKRKFFTYGLVSGTQLDGTEEPNSLKETDVNGVIVPVTEDNQCVWIYVDECTEPTPDIQAIRSATISLIYGTDINNQFYRDENVDTLKYVVNQHKLFAVSTTRSEYTDGASFAENYTYHIEHEEEYLHNFDVEDTYDSNQTQYEGMEWGLSEIQLSHLHDAIHITANSDIFSMIAQLFGGKSTEQLCNDALKTAGYNPKYDFYLSRDTQEEKLEIRDFSGYEFNKEIAIYLKETYPEDERALIDGAGTELDKTPKSALAYCLNRNKRKYPNGEIIYKNVDGSWNTDHLIWYMPAIDEIEDIIETAHSSFSDFHGKKYWSCQPAYNEFKIDFEFWKRTTGFGDYNYDSDILGSFYMDNVYRARATKAERENGAFKDVISSATDFTATQFGTLKITTLFPIGSDFDEGSYELNKDFDPDYEEYPGNLSRDTRARVRAVRGIPTSATE